MLGRFSVPACFFSAQIGDSGRNGRIRINGIAGIDFLAADAGDYRAAGEALAGTGVVAYQPTFVSSDAGAYEEPLRAAGAAAAEQSGDGLPLVLGVHLEGPFLSTEWPGAHDPEHLRHLGVPELDGAGRIVRIVEKPEQPPSEFAVTGVYFYDETVWDVLPTLVPSGRGELEITDVNNWYVEQGTMEYDVIEGFWGDAGESIDAYYTANDFVRASGANHD